MHELDMIIYYYKDKFNNVIFTQEKEENREYLGSIEQKELEENFLRDAKENKQIDIDESGELFWKDKEEKKTTLNELWCNIPIEIRRDKTYLYRSLKYKFLDDKAENGIDESLPLISFEDEILTCDLAREKIMQWIYDDEEHKKKAEELNKLLVQAKEYIRTYYFT